METKKFIVLKDLEVYSLARKLSSIGWSIYRSFSWQDMKIIGDQFIRATDSVGANIAEGYARFHYLDKIKFYYQARGSFIESAEHWLELLKERSKIDGKLYNDFKSTADILSVKLNNFITGTYKAKENNEK